MGRPRGGAGRLPRRGRAVGLGRAGTASVLAGITGDTSARFTYPAQPVKFAAMEGLYQTQRGAPIHLGGIPSNSQHRVLYAIEIRDALSLLAAFDPNALVQGLDSFPRSDWPNPVMVHLSFDTMAGVGTGLGLLSIWFWVLTLWRRRLPSWRPLLIAVVVSGPAAVIAMETGWFVTAFGRHPWNG